MELHDSWLANRLIAHRGLHNKQCPENTLAAFSRAIEAGYAVEMDVQMTRDGELVVFHDYDLERLTGLKGDIRKVDYSYIKDATILGTDQRIPLFEEFLKHIDGRIPILIEVKHHRHIGPVEEKIAALLENYSGEVAVESFNPLIILWFKRHAPKVVRGQLSSNLKEDKLPLWQKFVVWSLLLLRINGSQFLAYDADNIHRPVILRLKKRMPVVMWTVRDPKVLEETKGYYDNYMFEGYIPQT